MYETIAFHVNSFSLRGTEVAIYDYAHYNEELLNNKSIIFVQQDFNEKKDYRGVKVHNDGVYNKFNKRFTIIQFSNLKDLCNKIKENNVTIFYNLKSGEKDNLIVPSIKNVCHCVFTYNETNRHGDIYIPISPTIVDKNIRDNIPHVPHIVSLPKIDINLRDFLHIPRDAVVFGRHGGEETFNIPFVHKIVQRVADENENIYFLFLNTQLFCQPRKNVIFIQGLSEVQDKMYFINTCDAMLHARVEGESFGMAIAEFSINRKPVITWKHPPGDTCGIKVDVEHTHHLDILGSKGIYYSDEKELDEILTTFVPREQTEDLDCYSKLYSPQVVMDLFKKHIIDAKKIEVNEPIQIKEEIKVKNTSTVYFDGNNYTHFNNDDVAKSLYKNGWEPHVFNTISRLLTVGSTFIDIGANIGYHTVRIASNMDVAVISIEPQKDIFNLLEQNVEQNKLKNVMCINAGICDKEVTKYIPSISIDSTDNVNMGDIQLLDKQQKDTQPVECMSIDYIFSTYNDIAVIKIDVSGSELEVLKGGVRVLVEKRPYIILPLESHVCKKNGYSCGSIKNLLYALKYSMIEIYSEYPCDHLCYPNEKEDEVKKIFGDFIQENKTLNKINGNLELGIDKTIKYQKINSKVSYNKLMKRVKLMCNWTSGEQLCNDLKKMSQENCRWNDIQVTHEDNDIDYYVIINKPPPNSVYNKNKTIVFRMEPDTETSERWNDWYESKDDFMYFLDLSKFRNNSEWHLDLSYNDRDKPIEKTKVLSTVLSSLYFMEGHKKRVDFVKYLQKYTDDIKIDVYGKDNEQKFDNYKGPLPYHNKNDGILPYKYTFIAENCSMKNYFTEKLIDAIIGESLCFYWGCPNVESFIDSRAFIRLDLDNFEESMNIIKIAITYNEWSKRISIIRKEKQKIMNYYSFFPRVESLIRLSELPCVVVNLDRRPDRWIEFKVKSREERFSRYSKFSAIDGSKMDITPEVISMFKNFPRKPKRGEVGCALSHFNIWKTVEKDTLVLEDDISFIDNFVDKLSFVYNYTKNNKIDFDVLFIGYHLNEEVMKEKNLTINDIQSRDVVIPMSEITSYKTNNHMFGYNGGGTFGYIVSPQGAKKMVQSIEENGFVWPVDYHMMLLYTKGLNIYCVSERLVLSDMFDKNKSSSIDTDIQNTQDLY